MRRAGIGWPLLLFVGVCAVGFMFTWRSVILNAAVILIFWSGFFLFLRHMFFGGPEDGRLARRKTAVLLGSTAISLTGLMIALFFLTPPRERITRTQGFARYEEPMTDDERDHAEHLLKLLGWGPFDAKGALGMWQTPVDNSRDRILIMGDSVMYAWGVEEHETTAAYLDQMLPDYQVLNLAVSGWSIDQYYLYLRETLKNYSAEVVVVGIFAGNDYQITVREYGWGHSKPFFVMEEGELKHMNPDLLAFGCIDQMAQSFLFRHLWTNKYLAQKVLKTVCRAETLGVSEGREVVRALIRETQKVGEEHGAKVLFLLLPDINEFVNVGSPHYRRIASFYPFLQDIMEEGGYDYLEVGDFLGADAETIQRDYFVDQGHYTPKGHMLVAEALRDYITRNYLSESPPDKP